MTTANIRTPNDMTEATDTQNTTGQPHGLAASAGSPLRQTGVTAKQMQDAPNGAIYVWVNGQLDYPRRLAENLNRTDLVIVSPGSVRLETVVGRRVALIVDHACRWTRGIAEAADYLRRANDLDQAPVEAGATQ